MKEFRAELLGRRAAVNEDVPQYIDKLVRLFMEHSSIEHRPILDNALASIKAIEHSGTDTSTT